VDPQDSCNRWPYLSVIPVNIIGLGSSLRGAFKKLASFIAHSILIKVKVFTPKLAKVGVKT